MGFLAMGFLAMGFLAIGFLAIGFLTMGFLAMDFLDLLALVERFVCERMDAHFAATARFTTPDITLSVYPIVPWLQYPLVAATTLYTSSTPSLYT